MRQKDALYFILNPSLGIIKIGIAGDVEARRLQLECGVGVPLQVLRVVPGGGDYEKDLHDAFGPSRLLGEWFAPTVELMAVIDGVESVPDCVQRKRRAIDAWAAERERRTLERRAEQAEAAALERAEIKRLHAEQKRLEAEKKAAAKAAAKKAAKKREEQEERRRVRAEEQRAEALQHGGTAFRQLVSPSAAAEVRERQSMLAQRERNAALVGVLPLEFRNQTQRGATVGASEEN